MIQNLQQQQAKPGNPGSIKPHNDKQGAVPLPPVPPIIHQKPLYERFLRLEPKEFEGSMDPLDAEDWLSSTIAILEFIENGLCAPCIC